MLQEPQKAYWVTKGVLSSLSLYMHSHTYIHIQMSWRVALGSLFQERTQDYRSQMGEGAIPHTCDAQILDTHVPLPASPSLPFSPSHSTLLLAKKNTLSFYFSLQGKILWTFFFLASAKPGALEALTNQGVIFKFYSAFCELGSKLINSMLGQWERIGMCFNWTKSKIKC